MTSLFHSRQGRRPQVLVVVALGTLLAWTATTAMAQEKPLPGIMKQTIHLYYKDLTVADKFFTEVLGLTKTRDDAWIKQYRTVGLDPREADDISNRPMVTLSVVQEDRGYMRSAPTKPVLITWDVADVDVWYRHLKAKGVKIAKELHTDPHNSPEPTHKCFVFEDPTGYSFEFVQRRRRGEKMEMVPEIPVAKK